MKIVFLGFYFACSSTRFSVKSDGFVLLFFQRLCVFLGIHTRLQNADIGQVSVHFVIIKAVTDDELIGHDKADMTILDAVVAESGLSLRAIRGHGRNRNLVVARNVAAWLMRDDGHTLTEIGKTFNRSHAAIIHMCDEVSYWLASPLVYRRELRLFERVKKRTGRK